MQPYTDPIISKYIDLIKANTNIFKGFYIGDPMRVPMSSLPALIISKNETIAGKLTNAEDEHGIAMILTVITDIRADVKDDKELAPGITSLYNIIEGRESDTLKLKTDSVLHILRNNLVVDASNNLRTDLTSNTRVDYGMTIGKRAPDMWAIEAQVEFVASFIQLR